MISFIHRLSNQNQIKSNDGFVVRSIQRNRGLLRITTIKYM